MSVKQQTKEQKTKKENTPLCRPRSFVFAIVLPCVVLPFALPFVTAIRGAAGRCFAGSCCCRSSLLVAAAGSCCCSVSAAGSCCCAFEIYYQVGLGFLCGVIWFLFCCGPLCLPRHFGFCFCFLVGLFGSCSFYSCFRLPFHSSFFIY